MKKVTIALVLLLAASTTQAASIEGSWYATQHGGELQLNLVERNEHSQEGFTLPVASLETLTAQQIGASELTPVTFQLRRAAGTIDFRGSFQQGQGSGFFTFTPNDAFVREMRDLGYEGMSDRRLFLFTTTNLTTDWVRDIRALGFSPSRDELEEIAIFKITPEYVREIRAEGYPNVSLADLQQLRIGHIDAARIREYRALGFKDMSASAVGELGIMKVTPEYIREIAAAGYPNLSASQLTELRIGHITAAMIRDYRNLGYANMSPQQLSEAGIQKVTPQYIEALAKLGYRDLRMRQLIEMKIFKVTPEFIEQMRAAGYENVPVDKLIQIRMSHAEGLFLKKKSS